MDPRVQQFVQGIQMKLKANEMTTMIAGKCWDCCIRKPGAEFSKDERNCIRNCVTRFVEVDQIALTSTVEFMQKNATESS